MENLANERGRRREGERVFASYVFVSAAGHSRLRSSFPSHAWVPRASPLLSLAVHSLTYALTCLPLCFALLAVGRARQASAKLLEQTALAGDKDVALAKAVAAVQVGTQRSAAQRSAGQDRADDDSATIPLLPRAPQFKKSNPITHLNCTSSADGQGA